MLRYLILSTPRCGSSTFMNCAQSWLQRPFVREPLNPWERPDFHPPLLHRKSVQERADVVCGTAWRIAGIKHVHDPFLDPSERATSLRALRQVLAVRNIKVILLSRSVREQFISMEMALQTRDWWSLGPGALPHALGPVQAGTARPIDDAEISRRLVMLHRATLELAQACADCAADFVEYSYEGLFCGSCADVVANIMRALGHFDANARGDPEELRQLVRTTRRFESMRRIYEDVAERHPVLRP
jgi:LPS sulfotransferase NodH